MTATGAEGHDAYEEVQDLAVPASEAFAFLSDVANLPRYLPPITSAEAGEGEEVVLHGRAPTGDGFESRGYLRVDRAAMRMEWGAQVARAYSGWLTVADNDERSSSVTVHVEFGPRSVVAGIQEGTEGQAGDDHDPTVQAVQATLETIRRQVEGEGGEAELPPLPAGAAEASQRIAEERPDIRTT